MSAIIIPFVPRPRGRLPAELSAPSRSAAHPDDLVMDHEDTAPCKYVPWHDMPHVDHEPA